MLSREYRELHRAYLKLNSKLTKAEDRIEVLEAELRQRDYDDQQEET